MGGEENNKINFKNPTLNAFEMPAWADGGSGSAGGWEGAQDGPQLQLCTPWQVSPCPVGCVEGETLGSPASSPEVNTGPEEGCGGCISLGKEEWGQVCS